MTETNPTAHKRFSPSASSRWLNCIGSVALIESLPSSDQDSGDNIHSRRGTCAHAVGELVLEAEAKPNVEIECEDYEGMEIEGVVVDEDIVAGAEFHVDYCRGLIMTADEYMIEESDDLLSFVTECQDLYGLFLIVNGEDVGGTSDFAAIEMEGTLEIVDYKNGRGLVEHVENTQMMIYGLGKLVRYDPDFNFDNVRLTVIQPNAYHDEGETRSWDITPEDLLKWATDTLLPAIELGLEVVEMHKAGEDISEYLVPTNKGCMWCPAKATCTKRHNIMIEHTGADFDVDFDENGNTIDVMHFQDPLTLSQEQEETVLRHADDIIAFVNAVKANAHIQAENGKQYSSYKIVARRSNRKLVGEPADVKKDLKKMGLHAGDYMTDPVLKSPAQLEKSMKSVGVSPKKQEVFMERFVTSESTGTNFVPNSAAGIALTPSLDQDFAGEFEDDDPDFAGEFEDDDLDYDWGDL